MTGADPGKEAWLQRKIYKVTVKGCLTLKLAKQPPSSEHMLMLKPALLPMHYLANQSKTLHMD